MRIGMVVIATNKYIRFVEPLWASAKQHFMQGHDLNMFVFTNQPDVPAGTIRIEQEHLPWPQPTLKRYHIFSKHAAQLMSMDYLFYSDADMRFADTVGNEVLGDLVATIHPGFYNKGRQEFSYECRPESTAFMAPHEGSNYFAGGFNGGKAANFLKMASTIKQRIDDDEKNGIIAVWHDESHMNKYLSQNPPTIALSPSYCYPESWNIPFTKRLLALDKDHHELRFT